MVAVSVNKSWNLNVMKQAGEPEGELTRPAPSALTCQGFRESCGNKRVMIVVQQSNITTMISIARNRQKDKDAKTPHPKGQNPRP